MKPQRSLVPCASGNVLFMICCTMGAFNIVLDGDFGGVLKGALNGVLDVVLALLPST